MGVQSKGQSLTHNLGIASLTQEAKRFTDMLPLERLKAIMGSFGMKDFDTPEGNNALSSALNGAGLGAAPPPTQPPKTASRIEDRFRAGQATQQAPDVNSTGPGISGMINNAEPWISGTINNAEQALAIPLLPAKQIRLLIQHLTNGIDSNTRQKSPPPK
jgi:hypothetical protein